VFLVFAEGGGGETTAGGASRLPGVLNADMPEVLLLLEGVNDLASGGSGGISPMISNLRSMVQQAQGRGIRVFLGTLPPEIPERAARRRAAVHRTGQRSDSRSGGQHGRDTGRRVSSAHRIADHVHRP
jgi:acyl-CoA thioesterase-1